jgi:hypothetical protein
MATVLLIALFCLVPSVLLGQNIAGGSGVQVLPDQAAVRPPTNSGFYAPATQVSSSSRSNVCVSFELLGVDQASSDASFGIVIGATQPGASQIKQDVRDNYSKPLLVISSNVGLSSIEIPVPLTYLQTAIAGPDCRDGTSSVYHREGDFRTVKSIFLLGQPRSYPDDWYELDDTATMYMCPTRQTQDQCLSGLNPHQVATKRPKPLSDSLLATTRDQDLTMMVSTKQQQPRFEFILRRGGWFIAYTYIIAVMPFVLIIFLFSAYIRRKREWLPEREVPAVSDIAFGVAATLVAILPLRAVLVPSSLPTLTRLDLVFGLGITLLVALALAWVFIWKVPKPPGGKPAQ